MIIHNLQNKHIPHELKWKFAPEHTSNWFSTRSKLYYDIDWALIREKQFSMIR